MTDASDSLGVSTNQPEANAMAVKKTAGTANRWSSEVAPLLVSSTSERGNSDEDMRIPPTGVDDALNSGLYSSESESQHLKRTQVRLSVQEFAREDGVVLSLPGSGNTWERFEVLASWAADDLSVGRIVEGHSDALAILAEAGAEPVSREATYGVWAARSSSGGTSAERVPGGWRLSGTKAFCSGTGVIDRALITADTPEGYRIFDISVNDQVARVHEDSWPAVGMANSFSHTLDFNGPIILDEQVVGPPDFYTNRPGFWFGAVGVAACWFGGAEGLVNSLLHSLSSESSDLVNAEVGLAVAAIETMRAVLRSAAKSIDGDPHDARSEAHLRALIVRQAVHEHSLDVLARVASAGGARPLCLDEQQSRRAADLFVYLSQHHRGPDAATLGQLARSAHSCN
jgi:hypothetical protein